ncbi:hypothetical protein GCM10010383_73250 [Streptomyces lomondensis]|uniref:ABC3 transporter permease C-terminal domain-containing protein n=2 Tax=Streptomyces lomondensis TaxID=68229 RepID=A0ABQ2XTT6_9ACTN|nr:hypothetical protein GCM10010383_73250 [Streptomyces lomondensis]
MSPATTLWLAMAGNRSDRARIALTALSAALGTVTLLAAATVFAVTERHATRYSNPLLNESGLRPGVAFAMTLLTIPVLTFVAQCGRLGAPARERRLASLRMAGATPRQVVRIAAVETFLASVLGVVGGFAVYFVGRALLDAPDAEGRRPLPTDVLPSVVSMAGVAVAVPILVLLLALLTLRRVVITPLGLVRGARRRRPSTAPGVLILAGGGACALVEPVHRHFLTHPRGDDLPLIIVGVLVVSGVLAVSVGIVTGTGWLTYAIGRLLQRFARRPAGLLAGRRMMADPFAGSRTFAAMLVALVIGSAAAGLSALTLAEVKAQGENTRRYAELSGQPFVPEGTGFYERAYQLVGYAVLVAMVIAAAGLLVALADGILARRRALASLVATGASHGLLARALSWQVISPVVPAVALATLAGMLLPRLTVPSTNDTADMEVWRCTPLPGDPHDACADAAYQQAHGTLLTAEKVPVTVHMPWGQLALLAGGAVTATVVVTLVGLLFLRMSTRVTELRTS